MLGRARLKMDFGKTNLTAVCILMFMTSLALAQEVPSEDLPAIETAGPLVGTLQNEKPIEMTREEVTGNGLVEIVYPVEYLVPYKERRPDHQFIFHFQYENFKPAALVFSGQGNHDSIFGGASAPVMSLSLGYKYNLPIVGVEVSAFFGSGGLTGGANNTAYSVQKKGVRLAAVFDGIMSEPYVVPYVGIQFVGWDFKESSSLGANSASPGFIMGTQAGLLFQLNWLEPKSALRALNDDGLNNSYLDLFIQQYAATENANLASAFNWGAGFRLEY